MKRDITFQTDVSLEGVLLTNNKPSLVVIAHGYGGNLNAFMPLAEELAEEHDVVLYALREHNVGNGNKRESEGDFLLTDAIKDHRALTEQLGRDYRTVGHFGFSVGATIVAYACLTINDILQVPSCMYVIFQEVPEEWQKHLEDTLKDTSASSFHYHHLFL